MIVSWNELASPGILSRYDLTDVFNMDEFGLFFSCLLNNLKGVMLSGDSRVERTRAKVASATGEKVLIFVIGKSNIGM